MNRPCLRAPRQPLRQTGLSLIELMVAILMAMFMAAALLFIYLGMRNAYINQDRLAQLQDSQRVAMSMLASTIEQAGYFVNPKTDTSANALPAATWTWSNGVRTSFVAGQALSGYGDSTGSGAQSDAIVLRYQSANNDGLLNCNGGTNTSGANALSTNIFTINASNELTCAIDNNAPVTLAGNIGRMQIFYGTDSLNRGPIDAYLPASVVSAQNLWGRVHSVKIRLFYMDNSKQPPVLLPNPVLQFISLQNKQ